MSQTIITGDCLPFSLCCEFCDAGVDVDTYVQAVTDGWTHLQFDPTGFWWTWLGVCPDCRAEYEQEYVSLPGQVKGCLNPMVYSFKEKP